MKPIVKDSNTSIVDPLIGLLKSLHIEVQYEAIELITLLMDYSVKDMLLKSLVQVLKPPKTVKSENSDGILFSPAICKTLIRQFK